MCSGPLPEEALSTRNDMTLLTPARQPSNVAASYSYRRRRDAPAQRDMKSCRTSPARSAVVVLALFLTSAVASADEPSTVEADKAFQAKDYQRAKYLYLKPCNEGHGLSCYK